MVRNVPWRTAPGTSHRPTTSLFTGILLWLLIVTLEQQRCTASIPKSDKRIIRSTETRWIPPPPLDGGQAKRLMRPNKVTSFLLNLRGGGGSTPSATLSSHSLRAGAVLTTKTTRNNNNNNKSKIPVNINVLIRFLFLCYYGSLGSIMPYLPVWYDSLGHGGKIIGLLGAVKPATTFLVAPIWGLIADESAQPFRILKVTFLVSLLGQLAVSLRKDAGYIMFMVFITAVFNAPVKSLMDSMVLDHIPDKSSYGRLRLWGQMGFGLGSSAVGFLLSKSTHIPWPETTSFSPSVDETLAKFPVVVRRAIEFVDKCWQSMTAYKLLFFSYAALSVPTWWCIQTFQRLHSQQATKTSTRIKNGATAKNQNNNNKTKKVSAHAQIVQGLSLLFHNSDALLFFLLVLVVGISSGVVENFAYVRIREVGGTGKEMGRSRLVSSVAGAPMFWFSGPLSKALGADRVLVLSLLSYVVRFIIYAAMRNPYHGLPAEALRGITFAAFWSTGTIYAHAISPPGLHATMLMFLNAMYGGLGQSLGAIIGGNMQHRFGTVKTFVYSAIADFLFVCVVIVYLSLTKDTNFRDPKQIMPKTKQ